MSQIIRYESQVDQVVNVDKAGEYSKAVARSLASFTNTSIAAFRRNAPIIGKGVENTTSFLGSAFMSVGSWIAYGGKKLGDAIESTHQDNQVEYRQVEIQ